jgi:glycosyltransferase involved in cell wall biosynthesis
LLAKSITFIEKFYFVIYKRTFFVKESSTCNADFMNTWIRETIFHLISSGVISDPPKPMEKPFPKMVNFGGMRRYKRPVESVYVLKNLIDETEVKLVIVGTGPQLSRVEDLVKELKLHDSVTFTGRSGEKELASIVAST